MTYFHYRCGERITLLNDNCTAVRDHSEFDNGLVITAEPLLNDVLFEIKIDRKVNSWSGSLEIGVIDCDPLHFDFPPCSSKIQSGSWIMASSSFFKNGNCMIERYGADLDKLNQDDRVGLMRTAEGDLVFYVNGESQGVAVENLPTIVYAIVDVYGKCVQISITSPTLREHNNDDCLSGSSVLAIDNDILNVTLGGDLSELSMSSSNSLDIRMDMNVSLNLPEEIPRPDKIRFHERCGSLVKLSNNNRTAERRRPLDEFNNGVVMTQRPLRDSELFEIRIDRLVAKWSGSIEMGITTHNPNTLVFPATMTNMRSGTIMMSGCGILTNGKGTKREYGDFNLDELSEGDRVGMMRKPDGNLHYFINGLDQGVAAQRVPTTVWGVIDLYGMTTKVSIVERDEREEQNLITRKNTRDEEQQLQQQQQQQQILITDPTTSQQLPEYYDRLTFHPNCGAHAEVINNGRTAHRPNAKDDFNNGVVLTTRQLKLNELFEIRLDRVVTKWAGSIEIGITTHSPVDLEFPFTMTNVRSGTWMMTGSGIMHNGTIILENYGVNLDRLQVGDRVGVVRKENGVLHFFVNGIDQGIAATNIPEKVYGVIDLYGQAVEASIVDIYDCGSPDTMNSSLSNTTLYSDLRFHHVHGKNARIVNSGLTALRPRPLAEFNDAIVFSNRPLRDGELFEIILDTIVDRWSGSIELGVTAVRPDDIILPSTATDLSNDTWMLSGTSIMENSQTIKNNYPLDLDCLQSGVKLGILRTSDKILEFYRDGIPQGPACIVPNNNIYAVIDLYGQCARVSIPCDTPLLQLPTITTTILQENCLKSDITNNLIQSTNLQQDLHVFSEYHSNNITITDNGRLAKRNQNLNQTQIYSATPLIIDELYEITIISFVAHLAGSLIIGLTEQPPSSTTLNNNELPRDCCYLIGNELRYKNKIVQLFTPNLNWLNAGDRIGILRTQENYIKFFINSEEMNVTFPTTLPETLYVVVDLNGACNSIAVTSHKLPVTPLKHLKLQDCLEQQFDELPTCSKQILLNTNHPINYEFHENHGRNIELIDNKTIAKRVASYNQGVVIIQPALELNGKVSIMIEQLELKWQSSLIVGVVTGPPERLNLPINALAFKQPCCIIANDWISINGIKTRSNYGQKLGNLTIGDTVGVLLTSHGLKLMINDVDNDILSFVFQTVGQPIYAIFDLYGQCQQIKIINDCCKFIDDNTKQQSLECEKADLESCEKERKLTLPIPCTASTSMTSSLTTLRNNNTPHSPIRNLICPFKDACLHLKKRLLLPDYFFLTEDPICYCCNCYKSRNQISDKDNSLLGWVRFQLKNSTNISTDKWHTSFYPTKIGNIRAILDRGQPLTTEQTKWGSLVVQKEDDVQVVFYPSLQHCNNYGFKLKKMNNQKAHAAFQLLIKPGAYSILRDPPEWSTKETGAIALHSLLIQISQC